jgi:hypothetical protein
VAKTRDPFAAFRINLEQQRKRSKDLVRARRRAGDHDFKLMDAQFVIARELGFGSWRELRTHVTAMDAARKSMDRRGSAPDQELRTLHIRCGSDIQRELAIAGFRGDFLSLWDWFPVGPVTNGRDWIERRARFHASAGVLEFDECITELTDADNRLALSAAGYERVVIWMEHDSHDQLASVRCLAHYARTRPPRVLELISIDYFPGSRRFIGLGQLPPEAMRLLWQRRSAAGAAQLELAASTWNALTSDDPRHLAALMRTGATALPHLARALQRHLCELPSRETGLGLTQTLLLQALAERPATVGELWSLYNEREPLPFLADTMFAYLLDEMGRATVPVVERKCVETAPSFRDPLAITRAGLAVLRGETDWLSLEPPTRWVGGVPIRPGQPAWRWDAERQDVVSIQL